MSETLPHDFFFSPEFGADPYGIYAGLREKGPVHAIDFPSGWPAFVVIDHEHGRAALNDQRLSKSLDSGPSWLRDMISENNPVLADNMLMADPPDHTRQRRLVQKAFTPRRIEALRPRVQEITDELIDAMEGRGRADLIDAFAFPLPIIVICELLGIPSEDRNDFRAWSGALVEPAIDDELAKRRDEASAATRAYFTRLIEERRARPREDLVSALVAAEDQLSEKELLSTLVLLLIAGHETTVNLIGNGTLALLRNPDQLSLLRERPELVQNAVEEFLRFDAPVERGTFRLAIEDMEIAGTPIPKGAFVHVSIGAAGRDPAAFEGADLLDVTRRDNHHVAFGHGIHFCLGAPLARLEGQIAFATLVRRLPDLKLAVEPSELRWRFSGAVVRGLARLPVIF